MMRGVNNVPITAKLLLLDWIWPVGDIKNISSLCHVTEGVLATIA